MGRGILRRMDDALRITLRSFADTVKANVTANAEGEPEAQLSGPVSALFNGLGKLIHRKIVPEFSGQDEGDGVGLHVSPFCL